VGHAACGSTILAVGGAPPSSPGEEGRHSTPTGPIDAYSESSVRRSGRTHFAGIQKGGGSPAFPGRRVVSCTRNRYAFVDLRQASRCAGRHLLSRNTDTSFGGHTRRSSNPHGLQRRRVLARVAGFGAARDFLSAELPPDCAPTIFRRRFLGELRVAGLAGMTPLLGHPGTACTS